MTRSGVEDPPLVSMVVPVYNSLTYLSETLDSLLEQGLTENELEVILVDDGSDDGSERVVDEYAARHPNFRVIHQEQSGGPATPCNVGAYAARGRYFFLLGSDDVMTPNALRDLVKVAEREESDVVLGKLGSLGGRGTPKSVYKKTVYDADLVEHKIFNTLSAVKLFRTQLLHRTGALHPKHLAVGSDQPFTATLYLAARKFSICSDREYVLIRRRKDGSNVTRSFRSPADYVDLATAVLSVIVAGTEPGPLRDGVVRRTFRRELPQIVRKEFLDLPDDEQQDLVTRTKRMLEPVYNEATALHADPLTRSKVDLIFSDDVTGLRRLIEWENSAGGGEVVHDGQRFVYAVPEELRSAIGADRLHTPVVKGDVTLTDISYDTRDLEVGIAALALSCTTRADATILRLRNRQTGDEVDVPTTDERTVEASAGSGNRVRARIDLTVLQVSVWDAYVIQRFGDDEVTNRFGSKKAEGIDSRSIYLFDEQDEQAIGKAYFTVGFENLSLDIGFVHTKNELPEVTVHGLVPQVDGSEIAIMSIQSGRPVDFLVESEGTTRHLPVTSTQLDRHLHSVVLPPHPTETGAVRRLVVRGGGHSRDVNLPAPIGIAAASRTGRSHSAREDERAVDIFRAALGDLGIVGRRAVRRVYRGARSLPERSRQGR